MTQPTLPDAAAQQQAAVEVFAQYEPPLYEAYLDMMLEWLAAVRVAMFTGGVATLGLVPDPLSVFSQTPKWTALTAQYTEQVAREVLAAPYKDLFADGTVFESRPFVRNWIAARENRLSAVPNEVFGLVSHIIDSATTNGASIPDVQAQVEQLFGDTSIPGWKNRARTVARTEVVGAYNGGLHDAFSMIVDNDPDTEYVKRWLATEDKRTRPDHVEADGQTVPFLQPFTVGGFQMMHPHDPTAPAKEVVNCVVGSTQIGWPGQAIQGSTARRHVGPFVKLCTAEGHDLTVTPNHPVLTPKGYIPAGLLRPGQYVMGTLKPPAPQVGNGPSSAEEIHRALSEAGKPEWVVGSRMDFHGDGADTEVQVVSANGYLPGDTDTERVGKTQKLLLLGHDSRERPLSGLSDAVVTRMPSPSGPGFSPTRSLVSRRRQRTPLYGGQPGHADAVGLAAAADFQTHLRELPDDGRTADADFPAHLQYALAAGMAPCEIIEVERFTGDHEVFNLSTSDHWYTANGIATHNCRCVELLEIKNEPTKMSNRQYIHASGVGLKLMQAVCDDGSFCMQTHKPGLCKGQKRGETEPGQQDATQQTPVQKAQTAVTGLTKAIGQAQAVAQANLTANPKLAAMARKAVADYRKALGPHQQTLKQAAGANAKAKRTGVQDTKQQAVLDRRAQRKQAQDKRHHDTLEKRAQAILDRRKEAAKVAKMSPKQRAAYGKAKSAQAKTKHRLAEAAVLKKAGRG
jgi:hypothetical protein